MAHDAEGHSLAFTPLSVMLCANFERDIPANICNNTHMDQAKFERCRDEVVQRFGRATLSFLDRAGFVINRVEFLNTTDLALNLALSPKHKERLGLTSDELLLLLLANRQQYLWFHDEIRTRIRRHERLDRTAAVVLSNDPNILNKCAEARPDPDTGYFTSLVALGFGEIRKPNSGFEALEQAFHQQAFVVDHFDCRVPVVGDNLFGRRVLVTQLESEVRRGGQPIGLFGLRRVGKSSVLNQLVDQLRNSSSPRFAVAVADLQRDSYNTTTERLAATFARELALAAEQAGSRYRDSDARGFDRVGALCRHLIKKNHRVVLAIDEIEWLIPNNANDDTRAKDFLSAMGSIRGLKHELGDALGIVVCGINEHFTELGTVLGYPNPVLDFFNCRYVAGLERSDFDAMLKTLGHRMGISFAPNFLFQSFKQFGGHPYFARQFCKMVAQREGGRPLLISDAAFSKYYDAFLNEKGALLNQVMDYLHNFYPEEYSTLESLAVGSVCGVAQSQVRHLTSYGVVAQYGNTLEIKVDAIGQWLRRKRHESVLKTEAVLPARFETIAEIGSGATARVFRVRDRVLDEERAVKKYLPSVDPLTVRSELSVLREIRSSYVVSAYDVIADAEGGLCLVMDYVPGRSLETILQSQGRLNDEDLELLAEELFCAIDSIHPNFTRIDQLKELPELDPDMMREYLSLRDSGYLHRDIKPSNIVVEDERSWRCRLVDLGLARPARDVGHTRVGTEAYVPPDWGGSRWDASFDLYAIGVILHRATYGRYPARTEQGDLQTPASATAKGISLWPFFAKSLASDCGERFQNVREMRNEFRESVHETTSSVGTSTP